MLDEIGKILIQWPQLKIEIGGHADARGSDAYNMDLTQKRAQSVLDYLIQGFPQIKADQYTAMGYGERKPVASNKTVEGMAKNRRVEFKVLNTGRAEEGEGTPAVAPERRVVRHRLASTRTWQVGRGAERPPSCDLHRGERSPHMKRTVWWSIVCGTTGLMVSLLALTAIPAWAQQGGGEGRIGYHDGNDQHEPGPLGLENLGPGRRGRPGNPRHRTDPRQGCSTTVVR